MVTIGTFKSTGSDCRGEILTYVRTDFAYMLERGAYVCPETGFVSPYALRSTVCLSLRLSARANGLGRAG